jgi:uncharacterized lipoprotein YajG
MKRVMAWTAIFVFFSSLALAGAVKTYQVTGPVLDVSDDMVAVQKGSDRWEIARSADTKITGDLKKGAKVTIEYRMTATKVEVKDKAKPKETKPAETKKKK